MKPSKPNLSGGNQDTRVFINNSKFRRNKPIAFVIIFVILVGIAGFGFIKIKDGRKPAKPQTAEDTVKKMSPDEVKKVNDLMNTDPSKLYPNYNNSNNEVSQEAIETFRTSNSGIPPTKDKEK